MADERPHRQNDVTVRPAAAEDAETLARWLNDPRVIRYLTSNLRHGGMTPALVRSGLRRADQSWHVIEASRRPVGLIAFDTIDREDGVANMWYLIGEEGALGRGIAAAAIGKLLTANPLRLHAVTAWVGEPNAPSLACLDKAGFRRVGTVAGAFVAEGRRSNRILFEKALESE
ncbi:MAG: GNAT family protein [Alphaproteobacteria bacterium]